MNFKKKIVTDLYEINDSDVLPGYYKPKKTYITGLQTLDELLEKDKKREEDGFPRKIRLGRIVKRKGTKDNQVIVVPTTTEPKFEHDDSISQDDEEQTGGSGEGEEGEILGERPLEQDSGSGAGPGQGDESEHEVGTDAFDLGKVLTEKFNLPNLKDKGKKRSLTKFTYDLTDRHRGFGQVIDKKATLEQVIKTNIILGNVREEDEIDTEELIITPQDQVYRILSKEKDYENQAIVFFLRDYSGSMQGKPTEVICTQHLFIYSWLMYQYQNNVIPRFILHDSKAKEVPDFYTYYRSQVAGGTNIYPAYELVNQIVEMEHLNADYNIYVFHGTDGDDWDEDGRQMISETTKMLSYVNRIGITVAKNSWGLGGLSAVEKYLQRSNLLKERSDLIKMDVMPAETSDEKRIIEGIKILIS